MAKRQTAPKPKKATDPKPAKKPMFKKLNYPLIALSHAFYTGKMCAICGKHHTNTKVIVAIDQTKTEDYLVHDWCIKGKSNDQILVELGCK
jgi:hypothetical protein